MPTAQKKLQAQTNADEVGGLKSNFLLKLSHPLSRYHWLFFGHVYNRGILHASDSSVDDQVNQLLKFLMDEFRIRILLYHFSG